MTANRSVNKRGRRLPGSRERLLTAAAAEFAAHGYDALSVDRIARTARLNKAMIYYHFASKADLYRAIIREILTAVLGRVRQVAGSDQPPAAKIAGFVRGFAIEAQTHPGLAPLVLREMAEGGRHLDRATLDLMRQIPETLGAIVNEGRAAGVFRPCHPLMLHFSIVGPLVLYFASSPVRQRLTRARLTSLAAVELADLIAYLEQTALATLGVGDQSSPNETRRRQP